MNADDVITIFFIGGALVVAIGIYPYVIRILKSSHAAADSLSDLYHHSIKPKQHYLMAKKTNPEELHIDAEDIQIDRSELEVVIPEEALSSQLKVIAVNQMHADMIKDINRKRPVTLWGQERLINKVRNQNMRLELTIDQIGLHNTMIREAAKLEATMRIAPQLIEHELEMMLLDHKIEKKRKIESFLEEMHEIESRSKYRDIEIKIKDAEHDRYIMETKMSEIERKAKINLLLTTNEQEKARASLMEQALELFKAGKLSEKLQAYLIICVFNPGDQSFVNLGMDEEMQDLLRKEKAEDVNKKKWEAESMHEDVEHKREKLKRQRKQQDNE